MENFHLLQIPFEDTLIIRLLWLFFCFRAIIKHRTPENQTITIRYRDTMIQERIAITQLREILAKEINWSSLLS